MFQFGIRRKLQGVEDVLTQSHRGIYKRIDENRELLELLLEKAPDFLQKHFWVEGWLRGQDEFLGDLLAALPVPKPVESADYPRPWPTGKRVDAKRAKADLSSAGEWGLSDDVVFRVTRQGQTSPIPCTFDQMRDFLDACGLDPTRDEAQIAGIIAGVPFEVDGATMQFEQLRCNGARVDWAMHAYPLKRITIEVQGTRHSDPENMLLQVEEVVGKIRAGDLQGEAADDDFGYKFSVALRSDNPSIFGNDATRNTASDAHDNCN